MNRNRGFSLVEVIVTVTIIAGLLGLGVATLSGLRQRDSLDRASSLVYDDLILIRSKAIAVGKTHRIRWTSETQWVLEYYDDTLFPASWVQFSQNRQMPNDIYLMTESFSNAGSNLEATARGIYQFQNGKTGSPYLTIEGVGVARTKSFYVYTGGAIEIRTP
ncbi:MAG: prepilin-type N-terminal cleavage/methylation domain-containing protein [Pseudomonadota bacterium]